MSTNFDMFDGQETRHLGQRAGGWQFMFRAYPEHGVTDTQSWLRQLDAAKWIRDEYGRELSVDEFLEAVEACANGKRRERWGGDWYDREGNCFSASEFS